MPKYLVSMEMENVSHIVGILEIFETRGNEHYRFQYDDTWINHPLGFSIDPLLDLRRGVPFIEGQLWGTFKDISPDRWGRFLQQRASAEYISESGFMVGVSDTMRMGAMRISLADDPQNHLSSHTNIPKFVMLSELMEAIKRVEEDDETPEDIRILLKPGASLGGARPKAIMQDGGSMWIAKFPSQKDTRKVALWEALMLKMAGTVGIETPEYKVVSISRNSHVLLVKRFDRTATGGRIPFMSAMTLLGRHENSENQGSYLEIAETFMNVAANPSSDARQLWKRMVFNVLAGNTDDHLRNHGFLRTSSGWVLSPAYDLNPTDIPFEKRSHALSFDGRINIPSLETCLSLSHYFRYDIKKEAMNDLELILDGISSWKRMAKDVGLESGEISRMEKFFNVPYSVKNVRSVLKM